MIRVAVVDDHVVVRMGLRHLIASCPDLEFCGEFGGGKGAVDFVSSVQPDVTLVDVRMPDMSGVEALREIITANPKETISLVATGRGADASRDGFVDRGRRLAGNSVTSGGG